MAGRTCREAVERVPSARAELTDEERNLFSSMWMNPLTVAVIEGDVEALEWLIQRCDAWYPNWRDEELSGLAAKRGKIESLTCLRANGCPWNEYTCSWAARRGHLEVLQWAHQNGCPWDETTCYQAAFGGQLEVLQWARRNGCPWDHWTCYVAAMYGRLEVLQWASQNGCPWNEQTWSSAHPRCRPYLIEHGCPGAE